MHAHWATTWMHIELNLNLKKKPCKSMFEERRRVRHKYLYKRPQKDYSQCSQHFNFKSMNDALCVALQYGSNHGNNCQHNQEVIYHKRGRNYKCKNQCNPCARKCLLGECGARACGVKHLQQAIEHGHSFDDIWI
eukprot:1068653_1